MFERFSTDSRRVIVLAQEEAVGLGHNYIGTEHLLLGLISHEQCGGGQILAELGFDIETTRRLVSEKVKTINPAPSGHLPFTPRAKKTLELALREALQLNDNWIYSHHLLLGMIREGEGQGAQIIVELLEPQGLQSREALAKVRAMVLESPIKDSVPHTRVTSQPQNPPADWPVAVQIDQHALDRAVTNSKLLQHFRRGEGSQNLNELAIGPLFADIKSSRTDDGFATTMAKAIDARQWLRQFLELVDLPDGSFASLIVAVESAINSARDDYINNGPPS